MPDPAQTSTAPQAVPFFTAGTLDSPLSAARMNQLVALLNVLAAMSGTNGIVVQRAEGNMVVKLSDDYKKQLDAMLESGGGGGSLNWKGEWAVGTAYVIGDIVIFPTGTEPNGDQTVGTGGTYVCVQAHTGQAPPTYGTTANAYWSTMAKGHWSRLMVGTSAAYPKTTILPGDMTMVLDSYGTQVDIDPASVPTTGRGKVIGVREIQVCEDGVTRKVLILASAAYD